MVEGSGWGDGADRTVGSFEFNEPTFRSRGLGTRWRRDSTQPVRADGTVGASNRGHNRCLAVHLAVRRQCDQVVARSGVMTHEPSVQSSNAMLPAVSSQSRPLISTGPQGASKVIPYAEW